MPSFAQCTAHLRLSSLVLAPRLSIPAVLTPLGLCRKLADRSTSVGGRKKHDPESRLGFVVSSGSRMENNPEGKLHHRQMFLFPRILVGRHSSRRRLHRHHPGMAANKNTWEQKHLP